MGLMKYGTRFYFFSKEQRYLKMAKQFNPALQTHKYTHTHTIAWKGNKQAKVTGHWQLIPFMGIHVGLQVNYYVWRKWEIRLFNDYNTWFGSTSLGFKHNRSEWQLFSTF